MMKTPPKVSVILPVFNAEPWISLCLSSVMCQTMSDLELIVVDDGSTDLSIKVISGFRDDRIIVVRADRNRGPAAARNEGLDVASGEWITFIDADDMYVPERLSRLLKLATVRGWQAIVVDDVLKYKTPHPPSTPRLAPEVNASEVDKLELLAGFNWKVFVSRRLTLVSRARFPVDRDLGEDLFFFARLVAHPESFGVRVREPLYMYKVRSDSLSQSAEYDGRIDTMNMIASDSTFPRQIRQIAARRGQRYREISNALSLVSVMRSRPRSSDMDIAVDLLRRRETWRGLRRMGVSWVASRWSPSYRGRRTT